MRPVECGFETEALSAALQSRWPDRVDPELRAHAAECAICSDVLAVAASFDEAREDSRACGEMQIPPSGHVWHAAQLRARREAAARAMAPISVAQMIGFGCALGLAGACFGATSTWFQSVLAKALSSLSAPNMQALIALAAEHGFLIAGGVVATVLVPTAIYLTASSGD
jgi:hypothetical protein